MALPTGLGQRALQNLRRPSALDFIGVPALGAQATQPVPQNIMGLRQKVLEQQMRPRLSAAQQFQQMTGRPVTDRMPAPPPMKTPQGLLSSFMPESGTPEMAGFGAAGQKLLELSGYREVPITMAEALGQAAGAYGEARGAALKQQKEEQAAQAAAERQARLDAMAAEKQAAELANIRSQMEEREKPKKPDVIEFFDPDTGRPAKGYFDEQGNLVKLGGVKAPDVKAQKKSGFVAVYSKEGEFIGNVREDSEEADRFAEEGYQIIESTQLTGGKEDIDLGGLTKADFSKKTLEAFSAEKNIQDLEMIKASYSPEFQTLSGKAKRIGLEFWDMIDPDTTSPEGREYLTAVTQWKTRAWNQINDYIKEITGAQMSEKEAERILRSLPNPEDKLFKLTSPTVYMAALDTAIDEAKLASARTKYFLAKGLKPEFVKSEKTELNPKGFNVRFLDEDENLIRTWDGSMQKVISKETKSLLSKYKDLPSQERVGAVNAELYRLFGLRPADLKKYLSQTGV